MFEIRKVSGRGEGCVALRQISRGEILFREKAIITRSVALQELECFIIQNQYHDDPTLQEEKILESEIWKVFQLFENLSSSYKSHYLELSHHPNIYGEFVRNVAIEYSRSHSVNTEFSPELVERVFNIYRTNAFNNGLFLNLAKFNHSCYPNAEIVVNEDATRDVIAIDDIEKGKEIVHNYLNNVYEATSRRKEIWERWNFYCNCRFCDTQKDLKNMMILSEIEKEILEQKISIEKVMKSIDIFRKDVRKIRIEKTLHILDLLFDYACIFGYNSLHFSIAKRTAALGKHLSNILHYEKDPRHQKWCHRENYFVSYFIVRKIVSIIKATFAVLTPTIILLNYIHVNVTSFIVLTITWVMSQKI